MDNVRTTPTNKEKTSCSGKKLVQTTLSFKNLSSNDDSNNVIRSELKKKKLCYDNTEELLSTNIKISEDSIPKCQSKQITATIDLENKKQHDDPAEDEYKATHSTKKTDENVKLDFKHSFANKKKRKGVQEQNEDDDKGFTGVNAKSVLAPKRLKLQETKDTDLGLNTKEKLIVINSDDEDTCHGIKPASISDGNICKKHKKDSDEQLIKRNNTFKDLLIESESDNKSKANENCDISKVVENDSVNIVKTKIIDDETNKILNKKFNLNRKCKVVIENLAETQNKRKKKFVKEKQRRFEERERLRRQENELKEQRKRREKEERVELRKKVKKEREDLRRKQKEEKEQSRKKEREEKEKKRLAEIKAKNEEKKNKDDEKKRKEELKEEEKRRKEEERRKRELEKEEAENKKKKAAEAFSKFFLQQKNTTKKYNEDLLSTNADGLQSNFMPFQVKGDMKLAPILRRVLKSNEKTELDEFLYGKKLSEKHYLHLLKFEAFRPRRYIKVCSNLDTDSVKVVDDELDQMSVSIDGMNEPVQKFRAKYFSFHENRRPPYYGTFRKNSQIITPRRPFALDKSLLDYEIDSDDEWEEEEPGESLNCSEVENESEDDYEVDNAFFVPHGHLSDEELQNQDEVDDENSPETQKEKLKILHKNFVNEMKKKTEKLKPRLVGIIWQNENGTKPESCPDVVWKSLTKRSMISLKPINFPSPFEMLNRTIPVQKNKKPQKLTKLDDKFVKELVMLVHNNRHSKEFLIKEFQAYLSNKFKIDESWGGYTKSSIRNIITKIAEWKVLWDEINKKNKLCWQVLPEFLEKYGFNDIKSIEKWKYTLKPKQWCYEDDVYPKNEKKNYSVQRRK